MKKLLLIALVFPSSYCFSQNFVQGIMQRLTFGFTGGANYSNFVHTDFKTQALVGYHAGALVEFKMTKNFSVREEFIFSTQGAKVQNGLFGQDNIQMNYLSVPILFKYRTNCGLYLEAGTQTGMLINDNIDKKTIDKFAKRIDLAAAGGLGYQSRSGFGIGVRYVAGLSKVGDFQPGNINPDFRNSVVQASIFYIF